MLQCLLFLTAFFLDSYTHSQPGLMQIWRIFLLQRTVSRLCESKVFIVW